MKKKDYIYIYDGNFITLLNLIKELIKNKIIPLNIKDNNYNANLFDKLINLNMNENEEIIKKIIDNLGINIFNTIYKIYLSNHNNKELLIYYFIVYSIKYHNNIYYMCNIPVINECLKVCKYVQNENHKMKGFLRFKELNNQVLYAEISPENNILPILVKHFKDRLRSEYWIIKDVKRNIVAIYNQKDVIIQSCDDVNIKLNEYSNNEMKFEELWKIFYQTIGIKERKNERCRMNFMPKKYWQYILEVSDEL